MVYRFPKRMYIYCMRHVSVHVHVCTRKRDKETLLKLKLGSGN